MTMSITITLANKYKLERGGHYTYLHLGGNLNSFTTFVGKSYTWS